MAAYRPLPIANEPDICRCPHKRSDAATPTCARIVLAVNELRDCAQSVCIVRICRSGRAYRLTDKLE